VIREAPVLPDYHGEKWLDVRLPREVESWPKFETRHLVEMSGDDYDLAREEISRYGVGKPWVYPDRVVIFLCDIHADTDAFFRSLVASGGVERTGRRDDRFRLTPAGKEARFIIGGDCLDKGPENLRLLRAIKTLFDTGADLELLAGNHDVRALLGFAYAGRKEPRFAHLFVRMGQKSIPLFREIHEAYLAGGDGRRKLLKDDEVKARLFPDESWFRRFPDSVHGLVPEPKIEKEVNRIREKIQELTDRCATAGMTLGMVHAAFEKARELFLRPGGEFHWFFDRMMLAWRGGSFLFIHAGVDDEAAALVGAEGVPGLNREFLRLLKEDLFELYHGPIGNTFRTKYRPEDRTFTEEGVRNMHHAGIYAIVHGHRNITRGQRIVMRSGILNWECDSSVDINTRNLCNLKGPGGAVTIFRPDGNIVGLSTDYPYAKVFRGAKVLDTLAVF
jgi:hypothetical protein